MNSLKSVIEIKNGKIAKRNGLKYPIFGGNGIIGYSNEYNYENIIIIGRVGANCGSVHKHSGKCWVSDNALAGLPINGCNDFNYYLIKSIDLNSKQIGSSQPLLTQNILYNLSINFPKELFIQQKIASVLSAIDDKIELNNSINAELEQMAKTLYDYLFVQFDFPNEEGKPYKSSGGKMVYNEVLKREIPKGWDIKKVKNIAKTGSGGTPKSKENSYYENGKIPWINSGELNNSFIVHTKNFITELGMNNSSAKLFPSNTILMAMYGATAGKTSIISFEATTNQAICAVMPFDKYLFHYTKFVLDDMYQYLINLSTGSARDNLSQEKIKELDIIIPEQKIIKIYSKIVSPLFDKIKNNLLQNQELASLRDWLLPMLMNGQVKVAD